VVVIDDLSSGLSARIGSAKLVQIDLAAETATESLVQLIKAESINAVIHLAARKQVGESVTKPEWYFEQNIGGMAHLLEAMRQTKVERLVFSSSAATAGVGALVLADTLTTLLLPCC
jgi:UDP-glucose 4-epimerase